MTPFVFAAVLLVGAGQTAAGDSCYHYGPTRVRLVGRLVRDTLPGPPNYESIAAGDSPQVVDFLILETPICTVPDSSGAGVSGGAQNVDTVQLDWAPRMWRTIRDLSGQAVVVTGTLRDQALGPDRAPLLIDPKSVRVARRP